MQKEPKMEKGTKSNKRAVFKSINSISAVKRKEKKIVNPLFREMVGSS